MNDKAMDENGTKVVDQNIEVGEAISPDLGEMKEEAAEAAVRAKAKLFGNQKTDEKDGSEKPKSSNE